MQQNLKYIAAIVYLVSINTYAYIAKDQNQEAEPLPISKTDTLNFSVEEQGLFNKLSKVLKFRENRNRREQERITNYIQALIKDGQITEATDSVTVARLLDSIKFASTKLKSIPNTTVQEVQNPEELIAEDDATKDNVLEAIQIGLIVIAILFGIRLLRSLLKRPKV